MKAKIFDIERNSYVDGPGIRTTVFFQGCNLCCAWCHNPESRSSETKILFFREKCIGCGKCVEKCKTGGIADNQKCILCGECALYCPNDARKVCGSETEIDEIVSTFKKDRAFFESSSGGITVSGGECMLQIDALAELLAACKKEGLSTAVDTAGFVPFDSFEKILRFTDLFLYDIKAFTPTLHKELTGADNTLIFSNLKMLFSLKKSVIIRIPVIGDANAELSEMEKIARFLSPFSPDAIELLPYHNLGESKYAALGQLVPRFKTPTNKQMMEIRRIFSDFCSCPVR